MTFPNIFTQAVAEQVIQRINALTPDTQAQWGKMNVAQMLAHCNVTYEMAYENIHPKPSFFMGFILKTFVKNTVTGDKPYKPSSPTASEFIIKDSKDFAAEKARLINYIQKTQQLGEANFEQKQSHAFGKLTANEWNTMFYKHLDHHLTQFGV